MSAASDMTLRHSHRCALRRIERGEPVVKPFKQRRTRSSAENFWSRVSAPTATGCREWQGYTLKNGYGRLMWNRELVSAHRLAWLLSTGSPAGDAYVCHRCDNRRCCEPTHLFLGDARENYADCRAKDRHMRGERQPLAKLTSADIPLLRRLWKDGATLEAIAKRFGICKQTVHRAATGRSWAHVGGCS